MVHVHFQDIIFFYGTNGFSNLYDVFQRFQQRQFQILKLNRFANKIKSTAIHGYANIFHIAVSRNNNCFEQRVFFIQFCQQCQSIHYGHIDVTENNFYIRVYIKFF